MPFKNEYLTEEEKQMIVEAKIHDPRYSIAVKEYLNPRNWTIDRERNIALIYCGELDRDEHYKKVFALLYKEFNNEHLISFVLRKKYFSDEDEIKLKKEYAVDLVKKWIMLDIDIPHILANEDVRSIYEIMTEALTVYGVKGSPNVEEGIKAFLEVGGEIIS